MKTAWAVEIALRSGRRAKVRVGHSQRGLGRVANVGNVGHAENAADFVSDPGTHSLDTFIDEKCAGAQLNHNGDIAATSAAFPHSTPMSKMSKASGVRSRHWCRWGPMSDIQFCFSVHAFYRFFSE
jgi:hypothetical protein